MLQSLEGFILANVEPPFLVTDMVRVVKPGIPPNTRAALTPIFQVPWSTVFSKQTTPEDTNMEVTPYRGQLASQVFSLRELDLQLPFQIDQHL